MKEHPDASAGSAQAKRPSLANQLLAYLQHWQISHLIGDATGAGEGFLNWLASALGETAETPFKFTRRSKAQLGVDFLALVETNRFKYWAEETEFDDAWRYFAQANHCTYALDPGRPLETHLRWFVHATTKITTPTGAQPLADYRLISATLVAEADKLLHDGKLLLGRAESIISALYDPLSDPPANSTTH